MQLHHDFGTDMQQPAKQPLLSGLLVFERAYRLRRGALVSFLSASVAIL
jgi:hypothetical protein